MNVTLFRMTTVFSKRFLKEHFGKGMEKEEISYNFVRI